MLGAEAAPPDGGAAPQFTRTVDHLDIAPPLFIPCPSLDSPPAGLFIPSLDMLEPVVFFIEPLVCPELVMPGFCTLSPWGAGPVDPCANAEPHVRSEQPRR